MLHFMKYKILLPCIIALGLAVFFSFKYANLEPATNEEEQKAILQTVMEIIERGHYAPRTLNDDLSEKAFDKFFETLDYEKKFFLASDINALSSYKTKIDDEVNDGSLEFFNKANQLFVNRIDSVEKFYKEILSNPFSFKLNDSVELDGKKLQYAKNEKELKERWYGALKYRTLAKYLDLKEAEEKQAKDIVGFAPKSDSDLEKEAREAIEKVQERYFKRLKKLTDNERFGIYVNSITGVIDPHTDYMLPQDKKRFDEMMSGGFIGIGASLQLTDEGKVKISSIITGSPSWKQGKLKQDDIIEKVAQGDEVPVDIEGYELEDVIKIIRGKKGTVVKLTVKHADGTSEIVPIVRDLVEFEEVFAKSAVLEQEGKRIGYIYLPEFYADFSKQNGGRRSGEDVAKEVLKLKNENVDGIVLDLRNNGGGSLSDVVDMAGIFIGTGPVVQVRSSGNNTTTLSSRSNGALYDGPLAIMISNRSASASEILAAAMQDYGRAVIVGSESFGKGTVQKIISLDQFVSGELGAKIREAFNRSKGTGADYDGIGNLKLTIQKFYRIDGGSTQIKGVTPDITLPDAYGMLDNIGEKRDPSSLPWDKIAAVNYTQWQANPDLSYLQKNSQKRIEKQQAFGLIKQTGERLKKQQDNNVIPLNETKYIAKQEEAKAISKQLEELVESDKLTLKAKNLNIDLARVNVDTTSQAKNKDWLDALKKDVYIAETTNILNDWIATGGKRAKVNGKKD